MQDDVAAIKEDNKVRARVIKPKQEPAIGLE